MPFFPIPIVITYRPSSILPGNPFLSLRAAQPLISPPASRRGTSISPFVVVPPIEYPATEHQFQKQTHRFQPFQHSTFSLSSSARHTRAAAALADLHRPPHENPRSASHAGLEFLLTNRSHTVPYLFPHAPFRCATCGLRINQTLGAHTRCHPPPAHATTLASGRSLPKLGPLTTQCQ